MIGKLLGIIFGVTLLLVILATGFLAFQGYKSRQGQAPGLDNGRLAACPASPNCINSEDPRDEGHFLPPLAFEPVDDIDVRSFIVGVVEETGGAVTGQAEDYVSAEYKSAILGFVDDVEFRVDNFNGLVHIRSASRVGKSDLGANPKRYRAIREAFEAAVGN